MKLSRSVRYAVTALVHLAKAEPNMPVMAKQIAQEHSIPLEYLLKILHQLTRTRILESTRGPLGGFSLIQSSDEINLLDVIEAIEGSLYESNETSSQSQWNSYEKQLAKIYRQAGEETANLLKKTTLTHLARS